MADLAAPGARRLSREEVLDSARESSAFVACLGDGEFKDAGPAEGPPAHRRSDLMRIRPFGSRRCLRATRRLESSTHAVFEFLAAPVFDFRVDDRDVATLAEHLTAAGPQVSPNVTFDLAGGLSSDLVDPTEGIEASSDQLGMRDYVSMLATVVADHTTPLPVSIGLFGEWGAGKSYFMGLLRREIEHLASSGNERYCSDIVQVGFNAWHYADSNLWASLGDEIFAQLADVSKLGGDERSRLADDLSTRLQRRTELDSAALRAREQTARIRSEMAEATSEKLRHTDALTAVIKSEVWTQLGVENRAEKSRVMLAELHDTAQDLSYLRVAAGGWRGVTALLGALALLTGTAVAAKWLAGVGGVVLAGAIAWAGVAAQGHELQWRASGSSRATSEKQAEGDVTLHLERLRAAETRELVLEAELADVLGQMGIWRDNSRNRHRDKGSTAS